MREKRVVKLSHMTLKEKISQMTIINGNKFDKRYLDLGVGGIFLFGLNSKQAFKKVLSEYKRNTKLQLFIATDMEGKWNPFKKFYKSKTFREIKDKKEAYVLGREHGKILKELGFNLNFSPVSEFEDDVWPGRSFKGSTKEIKQKIREYIRGLHKEKIMATAKHYPGKNMIKDPHKIKFKTKISQNDLELFNEAIKSKTDFIMVGHPIVYGVLDSKGKQSTISKKIISHLKKKFKGFVITDTVRMLCLRSSYLFKFKKVYIDIINAGNDVILDSSRHSIYKGVERRVNQVEKAVKEGIVKEETINKAVRKILIKKGYKVIS